MNDESGIRRGLLTRNLFEVLRDSDEPLQAKHAVARVRERVNLNARELSLNNSGVPRFETALRFISSWTSAIGWLAKRGGWSITEAGVEAIDEFPGDELYKEMSRRIVQLQSQRRQRQQGFADPRWRRVASALSYVEAGWWTTYGDIAELTGLSAQSVGQFMARETVDNAHRVLRADGTVAPGFRWPVPDRTDDPRQVLEREGVEFDESGRANPSQRVTADDFRERMEELGEAEEDHSPGRRAWLVRGSSVDGRDLITVWLQKGTATLAASNLRQISPPLPRDELKSIVEADYQHKSYAVRETKLAEFDAFCNRMRPGDYVLTTSRGQSFVGRITGDATYTQSSDQRSNLRRTVDWLNRTQPVPFANLPQPLPAKLHSQSDVVELTENIAAIETLLNQLGITVGEPAPAPERELRFREITEEFAGDLLIDRGWLQRQADLLWERKQVIFYGPPGTGKTYIARKLAAHLAEPSAVKLVQFHPSYTYEDFFEGLRPKPRADGQLTFEPHSGPFRKLVDAARDHPADPYILIIDEINRANIAKVFGELYFLLEYREDAISLLYSGESDFTLPPNVFVIGTMNTTDRTLALLDAAMRRRFAFVELHPSGPPISGLLTAWLNRLKETTNVQHNLNAPELLDALNSRIDERDLAIGPSYLMRPDIYQHEDGLSRVWENSILPQLAEHHYGGPPGMLNRYRLASLRGESATDEDEP